MDCHLPKTEARKTKIMDYARFLDFKLVEIVLHILSLEHAGSPRYIRHSAPHRVGTNIDATGGQPKGANAIAHGFGLDSKTDFRDERGKDALPDARKKGRAAAKPPRLSRNSYF
jgi:hypothetical protein